MNVIKKFLVLPLIKSKTRKNIVTQPVVVNFDEKKCIGYKIATSFKGNQKKKDIPPFYHDIYDNDKLKVLRQDNDMDMYCIFNIHENGKDFDYYVAVENKRSKHGKDYAEITLPKGHYVKIEFMKRNHTAAGQIVGYTKLWIESNGYEGRSSPPFILYDNRFHRNYQEFGCQNGNYAGDPIAALYVPITEKP
jgi:predicted transcriptional regulator YdeE